MSPLRGESVEVVAIEDALDQYADVQLTRAWNRACVSDAKQREANYKSRLVKILRDNGCKRVLDAGCDNGTDSMMLLDEGFHVVSVDASRGMLELARSAKAHRIAERGYHDWIIEQANFVTLESDIEHLIGDGFDAVICIGNAFPHILNSHGDFREQKMALRNFYRCIKPGGVLLIDHRNFDYVTHGGEAPTSSIFFDNKRIKRVESSVAYKNGKPNEVRLDFLLKAASDNGRTAQISLTFYPYTLVEFAQLIDEAFQRATRHEIYGDFKALGEVANPGFYAHLLQKGHLA